MEREAPQLISQSSREIWLHRAGPIIRLATEKTIIGTYLDVPNGFADELRGAMSERSDISEENPLGTRKYSILLTGRHESHPDGIIGAALASAVTTTANTVLPPEERMAGFIMPLAQSLEEGQQDGPISQMYQELKPTLIKFGLVPAPIVRAKDQKSKEHGGYEMQKDEDEEARMRNLAKEGFSNFFLFPEGTTTGGKTRSDGQVHGMVDFELNSIRKTCLFIKRNFGTETLVIPFATFGGRKILNPDNKMLSIGPLVNALAMPVPNIGTVKVGMPMRSDEGEFARLLNAKADSSLRGKEREAAKIQVMRNLNNFVGGKIARLVPEEEQGVYREFAKAA